jgi:ribosomal protein S26
LVFARSALELGDASVCVRYTVVKMITKFLHCVNVREVGVQIKGIEEHQGI